MSLPRICDCFPTSASARAVTFVNHCIAHVSSSSAVLVVVEPTRSRCRGSFIGGGEEDEEVLVSKETIGRISSRRSYVLRANATLGSDRNGDGRDRWLHGSHLHQGPTGCSRQVSFPLTRVHLDLTRQAISQTLFREAHPVHSDGEHFPEIRLGVRISP